MKINTTYMNINMLSLLEIFFKIYVFLDSYKEIKYFDQSTNLMHNKKEENILHKLNYQAYNQI